MITLACPVCRVALRLSGEFEEMDYLVGARSEWYPDRYPCPSSGCAGRLVFAEAIASTELALLEVHDLNPQEAFQALHGMGLPEEQVCHADAVRELLLGQQILSLDLQDLKGTNRCVLHGVTLTNGTRVYLGAGPSGAVVYRVAPQRSLVRELG